VSGIDPPNNYVKKLLAEKLTDEMAEKIGGIQRIMSKHKVIDHHFICMENET
jgi:hypothetical protein